MPVDLISQLFVGLHCEQYVGNSRRASKRKETIQDKSTQIPDPIGGRNVKSTHHGRQLTDMSFLVYLESNHVVSNRGGRNQRQDLSVGVPGIDIELYQTTQFFGNPDVVHCHMVPSTLTMPMRMSNLSNQLERLLENFLITLAHFQS